MSPHAKQKLVTLVVFGTVGLALILFGYNNLRGHREMADRPTVRATVKSYEVVVEKVAGGSKRGARTARRGKLMVTYDFGGTTHEKRVLFVGVTDPDALHARYPVGAEVDVLVDPESAARPVIIIAADSNSRLMITVGGVLVLAGVVFFLVGRPRREPATP